MDSWKRVGIVAKPGHARLGPLLERLVSLLDQDGRDMLMEAEAAAQITNLRGAEIVTREEVTARADLVIAVGGDGTLLGVAREIGARATPIFGISLGHLGFLTAVRPEDVDQVLPGVLAGRCRIDERARLEVVVIENGAETRRELVLNDVVLTKGTALARMIDLHVRVDDQRVATYRSDGLIVATPTGSTAYNLSAGGPLLDPTLSAILLTPICPHTLSQRPLVLPDNNWVEVRLLSSEEVTLTLDGQVGVALSGGDRVRIARSERPARLVFGADENHFETLRNKLGWGAS
ncbi:MAG: NAD(+)/NADH kinase [Myxococcota bacterium]|nr:NAD(+)/NADH kinase [Myxococcota bacterium]